MVELKYRAEIDGLRAFAVLSVIVFHAFPTLLPGGYVGVDVFFVISGYLITQIILKSAESGAFSLVEFYVHRIRRIFPALLFVLMAVLLFGSVFLFPDEYKSLAKHALGGALFLSNFVLWNESGYFDKDIYSKPLMHLWSLGVEEQFYLLWPVVLIKFKKRNLQGFIIACAVISSLLFCAYKTETFPAAAFFSPLSRFWELGVGSFMAWCALKGNGMVFSKGKLQLAAEVGIIVFLICPLFLFDEATKFPGFAALVPVLATAFFLMVVTSRSYLYKFFSNVSLVGIGKISYPLYLWHWPTLSYLYIIEGKRPPDPYIWFVLFLTFILAAITYKFVEMPLRFRGNSRLKATLLISMLACVGLYAYIAYKPNDIFNLIMGKTL